MPIILFLFIFTIQLTEESLIGLLRNDFGDKKFISPSLVLDITSNFISFEYGLKDLAPKGTSELSQFYQKALKELQKDQMKTFLTDEQVTLKQFKKDAEGAFRMCLCSDESLTGDLRKDVEDNWKRAIIARQLFELKNFSKCLFTYELTLARGYACRAPENNNISSIYKELVDLLIKLSPIEKDRQEKMEKRKRQEEQKVQQGGILVPIFGIVFIFAIAAASITLGLNARGNALEKENKGF